MKRTRSLTLAAAALVCSMFLGYQTASAAPAVEIPGPAPPPCFCLASYTITKSPECICVLEIVDLSWLASPNCYKPGFPDCEVPSNKKCELFADFEERGECGGSWPATRVRASCGNHNTAELNCASGGVHVIEVICDPCALIDE